jgi:hypothetical protein
MTAQSVDNLRTRALQVMNETAGFANDAPRVGSLLRDMIDSGVLGSVHSITAAGASPTASAATNRLAIQTALDLGGTVLFPGGPGTVYDFDAQLRVTQSNTVLWAPGGAKIRPSVAIPILIAVGNVDTQIITTEGNTLASNAAAGDLSVALSAGKGANFTAGEFALILCDTIIPDHDAAVVVQTCEIINVYSVATDTLNLNRPLRYPYTTAANAKIYRVSWIEGFGAYGLGIDGNNQIACAIGLCLSCCLKPEMKNLHFEDLQQRGIRMQYNLEAVIDSYFQSNGRSALFQGAPSNLNAYAISEGGACEGLRATNLQIDRCRHGYTTSGVVGNNGASSPLNTPGFGVPTGSIISGDHVMAKGAGWDTHETGVDITFQDCRTLGSLGIGFQDRCVRTKWVNCFARDTVGAAIQLGSDAQKAELVNFRYERTNLGTDEASGTDWTKKSEISDNSVNPNLGDGPPNILDNSSFEIWERNTSFTATGGTANRWKLTLGAGAAATLSRGTLAETRPDRGRYFLRFNRTTTGSGASRITQYIDGVRSCAGKRVTVSFDMRDNLGGSDVNVFINQYFGTGGSPSGDVTTAAVVRTVDGAWRRYNLHIDIPLLTGKTIGSNEDSHIQLAIEFPTAAGIALWDIDNVDMKVCPVATNYVMRSPADEKRACALWYEKSYNDGQNPGSASTGGRAQIAAYQSGLTDAKIANLYTRTVHMSRKGRSPTCAVYAAVSGTVGTIRNITQAIDVNRDIIAGYQSFQVSPTVAAVTAGNVVSGDELEFHWTAAVADFE